MNGVTSKIKYQPEEDARCKNANDTNYSIFIFTQKMQYFVDIDQITAQKVQVIHYQFTGGGGIKFGKFAIS